MKKETAKKFFEFLEKKEGKEDLKTKLIFSPETLPEGLEVGESLNLSGTSIKYLPEGLKVGKNLDLGNTLIRSLPEGLKVKGSLSLYGTPIQSLPEGLEVAGYLRLNNSSVQFLPKGLKVGWSLQARETPLSKKYTEEEIRKMIEDGGGYIKGEIIL